jgi:hypothetical protein
MNPAPFSNGRRRYRIDLSGAVRDQLISCQQQATIEGPGAEFIVAMRQILNRLQISPANFGEAIFRLHSLRMTVRSAVVRPIFVDFGVWEDGSFVFIRSIKLLGVGQP